MTSEIDCLIMFMTQNSDLHIDLRVGCCFYALAMFHFHSNHQEGILGHYKIRWVLDWIILVAFFG